MKPSFDSEFKNLKLWHLIRWHNDRVFNHIPRRIWKYIGMRRIHKNYSLFEFHEKLCDFRPPDGWKCSFNLIGRNWRKEIRHCLYIITCFFLSSNIECTDQLPRFCHQCSKILDPEEPMKGANGIFECKEFVKKLYNLDPDNMYRHNKVMRCGRCCAVSYCSRKCQKRNWKYGHRISCASFM